MDRTEFAMQRKLARMATVTAQSGVDEDSPMRWGAIAHQKVLEESSLDALAPLDVGNVEVLKEGALKKRIVTRTVIWADR